MNNVFRTIVLMAAVAPTIWARVMPVPEIDGGFAGSALAFAAGALLVMRGYRRRSSGD